MPGQKILHIGTEAWLVFALLAGTFSRILPLCSEYILPLAAFNAPSFTPGHGPQHHRITSSNTPLIGGDQAPEWGAVFYVSSTGRKRRGMYAHIALLFSHMLIEGI